MKKGFFLTLMGALFIAGATQAQVAVGKPAADPNDPVLMTIGTSQVRLSEFTYVYKKNNKDTTNNPQAVENYLDLFTTFKMKVQEAQDMKMDTSAQFRNELLGYRRQVANQYLTDRKVNDSLLMEAYNRMKEDVRASHILVLCDENALPRDTDIAYTKITILQNLIAGKPVTKLINEYESKLKQKFNVTPKSPAADAAKVNNLVAPLRDLEKRFKGKPAPFDEVAFIASEDQSARQNRGDLGYFTAFNMVYEFETLCYNTPVGQVGGPCQTKYGYHLAYVTDRRPAAGKIVVAHIMIKSAAGSPVQDSINAKAKADEIYAKVQAGEDFATLARQFSEDKQSAAVGGEMAKFGLYEMPQAFERAAFALQKDGDVSAPIKTAWGWHIIKRIRKEAFPTFEQAKPEIKQRVSRDSRASQGRSSLIARVKADNGFVEFPATVKPFYALIDSTYFMGRWSANKAAALNATMFTLAGKNYTQQDFARWIELHQVRGPKRDAKAVVDAAYAQWVEESVVLYEDSQLERKYPDFRNLMQEYRDGMLLFDLMDQKVWSKAVKDTAGLRGFYEQNKQKYRMPERADATIYSCKDEATAKKVRKMLKDKKTMKEILDELNKDSQLNVTAEHKMFVKGENEFVDRNWKKGTSKNEVKDGRVRFVVVDKIEAERPKTLQEARGAVTTDYQNQLDKEWIATLKAKYPVTVNRDVLQMVK
jgi:peptidyl-prolyl cis-trans isomerase SurA